MTSQAVTALEQRLFEVDLRIRALEAPSFGERRDHDSCRRAHSERVSLERELEQVQRAERRAAVRRPIEAVLMPRRADQVSRPWIWKAVQRLIDLCVAQTIHVQYAPQGDAKAFVRTRTLYSPAVLNEPNLAVVKHELGHLCEPRADAEQHAYRLSTNTSRSLAAPYAECAAWLWAIQPEVGLWTVGQHDEMVKCLTSYRAHATTEESDAISRTIAVAFKAIQPAPDTPDGRRAIADRVAAEWQPGPRLQARLKRLDQLKREEITW